MCAPLGQDKPYVGMQELFNLGSLLKLLRPIIIQDKQSMVTAIL
uniref:Uncharacterized protein n=1 Tax=Arundo donax TaxID=35708 RepID=A0A0A8Z8S4_ARUDO